MTNKILNFIKSKGYDIQDLCLLGVRTELNVPNVFNDLVGVVYKQPVFNSGGNTIALQTFLNTFGYTDQEGKSLRVDGLYGAKTEHAFKQYEKFVNKYRVLLFNATTDPGTYYLENPVNVKGAAVLKEGIYKDAFKIGYHKNKKNHKAFIQIGPVTVYRDNDKDNVPEKSNLEETGLFGINIHRAYIDGRDSIDKWSAGCQVLQEVKSLELMLSIAQYFKGTTKKIDYLLIREQDL